MGTTVQQAYQGNLEDGQFNKWSIVIFYFNDRLINLIIVSVDIIGGGNSVEPLVLESISYIVVISKGLQFRLNCRPSATVFNSFFAQFGQEAVSTL